jgi:hypothetical protein
MTLEAPKNIEFEGLMDEVRRYLAAVDVFRAEGREPRWAAEWPVGEPDRRRPRRRQPLALS